MGRQQTLPDDPAEYCPKCGNKLTEENRANFFGQEMCGDCFRERFNSHPDRGEE